MAVEVFFVSMLDWLDVFGFVKFWIIFGGTSFAVGFEFGIKGKGFRGIKFGIASIFGWILYNDHIDSNQVL